MNEEVRRMLTAVLLCMLILLAWQRFFGPQPQPQPPDEQQEQVVDKTQPSSAEVPEAIPPGWRLVRYSQAEVAPIEIGSLDPAANYKAKLVFDPETASVYEALLSEHKYKVKDEKPGYPVLSPTSDEEEGAVYSFMLGELKVRGRETRFDLTRDCWRQLPVEATDEGEQIVRFEATVVDENDEPMLRLVKTYTYNPGDYMLDFFVQFKNESPEAVEVESLELYGPTGLAREDARADMRHAMAAYVATHAEEGADVKVEKESASKLIGEMEKGRSDSKTLKTAKNARLQWVALANKYFAATMHPAPRGNQSQLLKLDQFAIDVQVTRITGGPAMEEEQERVRSMALSTTLLAERPIEAGEEASVDLQVYLGPIDKDIFDNNPLFADLHYEKLMTNRSCFCGFDWLTFLVIKLLKGTYSLVGNYGVAIILLVLLVRLILHPVQVRSQVNMMKWQKLAPKMEEIKQKYGNNQQEMQRKMMELQKEEGMLGNMVLGCLPMFLQMPIWIALFTAVNSNVAVRHQGLLPIWLNDLSAPDRLISFAWFGLEPIFIPFLSNMMGEIDALNLLPILGAIALYLQTKLSPQTKMQATTNPQAAQSQKMMLVMMPIMMLLFLYNSSSGFNLYFMASLFGGLIEQHYIRKHIKKEEAKQAVGTVKATTKISSRVGPKKKKPKPPVRFH